MLLTSIKEGFTGVVDTGEAPKQSNISVNIWKNIKIVCRHTVSMYWGQEEPFDEKPKLKNLVTLSLEGVFECNILRLAPPRLHGEKRCSAHPKAEHSTTHPAYEPLIIRAPTVHKVHFCWKLHLHKHTASCCRFRIIYLRTGRIFFKGKMWDGPLSYLTYLAWVGYERDGGVERSPRRPLVVVLKPVGHEDAWTVNVLVSIKVLLDT